MKKKIVFAMMETGGGHKAPATAIKKAIDKLYPNKYELKIMDLMKEVGCTKIDKEIKDLWDFLLAHPFLCKTGFRIEERMSPIVRLFRKKYLKPLYEPLAKFLKEYKPDVILSTHFLTSFAVDYTRRKYNIPVKLINFNSDPFDIHLFWVLKGVDHYIVCSQEAKGKLIKKGMPKDKLIVFSYPLQDNLFKIKSTKKQIAKNINLDTSKKTLIISFGGQGVGKFEKFIGPLIKENLNLNIILITGKNEQLKARLDEKYKNLKSNVNMIICGFVNNMNELIHISDFAFIKPGAATTFEFISMKKPIIFYNSATLSEDGNIRFVLKNRIGFYCGDRKNRFVKYVKTLLSDSNYKEFSSNYDRLNIKNGSEDIAKFVANITEKKSR